MKVALLGCDDVPERFRPIAGTYRAMFERLLKPHIPELQLTWLDLYRGEIPPAPDGFDAYICTGSRCSVYEDRDWIGTLKNFVRRLHDERKPFVGICFGHQMLAEALGGKVERAEQGWGVGVLDMAIVAAEPWMQPPLQRAKLQYMHADQVTQLPEGGVVLAEAAHCRVAMFRVGETMLGIEAHPEFPPAYEKALLETRSDAIGADRVAAALASLSEPTNSDAVGQWIAAFMETAARERGA